MHEVITGLIIIAFSGVVWSVVNLTLSTTLVDTNKPVTLTCTYVGSDTNLLFSWIKVIGEVGGDDDRTKGNIRTSPSCSVFGSAIDTTKYSYSCSGSQQVLWTINNVDRSNNGERWRCLVATSTGTFENSNVVSISVTVPIQSVDMILPNTDASVDIIENVGYQLKCRTDGGRPVALITWYKNNGTPGTTDDDIKIEQTTTSSYDTLADGLRIITSTLVFSATRSDNGMRIYCCANNTKNETHTSTRKPLLNVLYGPVVLPMTIQSAVEGTSFSFRCPYTSGKPATMSVTWTRPEDDRTWNSELLTISSVSRRDAMKYTCTVSNIMEPTDQDPVSDPKAGQFYLDVKYQTSIVSFFVEGQTGHEVTVEEHTSHKLICNVDSNPESNIKVMFHDKLLTESESSLQLEHELSNVSCGDSGVYKCIGGNYLNAETLPLMDLVLLVNCRPQPYGSITDRVYSAVYSSAALQLYSLAYPSVSSFTWTKQGNNNEILKNSFKRSMTLTFVETNETYINVAKVELHITSVSESDFGEYKLQVKNDVGMMETYFVLKPEEIPETPKTLTSNNDLIQSSEATIQWTPGFNGGTRQTFVLSYKKMTDSVWRTIAVDDTDSAIINYTLTDLQPGTQYQLKIYAENRVGASTTTDVITFYTLGADVEDTGGPNIEMIVGIVVGVTVLVAIGIAAIVFLLRRKRPRKSADNQTSNKSDHNPANKVSEDAHNYDVVSEEIIDDEINNEAAYYNEENSVNVYEAMGQRDTDTSQYLTLQPNSENQNKDKSLKEIKQYENLQLDAM